MAATKSSGVLDARARRSRELLRQALLKLVKTKSFEQISIREISKVAGVSFPTFYRQFKDKDELLSDIAAEELHAFMAVMLGFLNESDTKLSARAICDYVDENRALWRTLLTTGASAVMRDEFIRLSRGIVSERGQINPEYPPELLASFVASAIFEILAWWLSQPDTYPRRKIEYLLDILVLRQTMIKQGDTSSESEGSQALQ